jgi:uncharacterized repeat protein (TIGR01451 family)
MKKKLLGAGVLFIAIFLVLSSIAIADTKDIELETMSTTHTNEIQPSHEKVVKSQDGPIIWDNGGTTASSNLYSSQNDTCYPFVSQVADDFHFEEVTPIHDVHWFGGFWGGDPFDPCDFWIFFYKDDGTGSQPTGAGMNDPAPTAVAAYFFPGVTGMPLDPNGFYSYKVILDPPFIAEPCEKYWIAIQAAFCFPPQWGWANTGGIQLAPAVQGFPVLGTEFWTPLDPEVDMAWHLTGEETCEPCIDVEKYVWDKNNQEWIDADTESEALDVPICDEVTFKIVVHNCGDTDITDIIIDDKMHDSLKFISGDPEPDEAVYEEPFWYLKWFFPGPLAPCETIEVYITAHVEGPECSYDFNHVLVEGKCCGNTLQDEDEAWVHAIKKSKSVNMPFLAWLESHPNMFPLLQKLLKLIALL